MIVLKYSKMYPASSAGHVDTMRTLMRTIRRAKLEVGYSNGYNPHIELVMSPALSLGTESRAEYLALECTGFDALISRLNEVSVSGITFHKMWEMPRVGLTAPVTAAEYEIISKNIGENFRKFTKFTIETKGKDGTLVNEDVTDKIYFAKVTDKDKLTAKIACGNVNLRPDKFAAALSSLFNNDSNYRVIKTRLFAGETDFDDYLDEKVLKQ